MWLNVCFINEMALFGRFAALIKGCSSEEMADPQGMEVFAVERHGLPEDFVSFFLLCVWSAIVATRICAESAVCLGPATVVGTGRVSVLQVYVLLSLVLKLDERTLVHRVNQLTRTLPLRAPAETVECTSGMVEDGGRERLCSGCKPKAVSVDQMHSTHGAQSPPAHETASKYVGVR